MMKEEMNKEAYKIYITVNIKKTGEEVEEYMLQTNRPSETPPKGMIK